MPMSLFKLEDWCSRAVRGIRYTPDRNDVYNELYQHVQDRYESFTSKGIPEEEAKDLTIRAMGNPDELAPMLAEIHHSIWPYLVIITRWVTAAVLVVALITLTGYILKETRFEKPMDNTIYAAGYQQNEGTRTFYAEPNVTAELEGYTVTVTKVAKRYEEKRLDRNLLYFRMEISHGYHGSEMPDPQMWQWFWVEDSLGNQYNSDYAYNTPQLVRINKRQKPFRLILDMSLTECVSQDAQWLDVHYERDGRKMVLRIDLTEGVVS